MFLAPIVLFAYNRLSHLQKSLESLAENELASESVIYVHIDGPRNEGDQEIQNKIKEYLKSGIRSKFKDFHVKESSVNSGLANSIISGVSETLKEFGRVIVLEDDLVTSRYFLRYMNLALDRYENEDQVISIHGYVCPLNPPLDEPFFLKGADCWGWATWSRGWKLFESNGTDLLKKIQQGNLEREFNFENTYNYVGMLKDQILGKNNSWAIRWQASAFLNQKLTLYPGRTLVKNIGLDGSGTHCDSTSDYVVELSKKKEWVFPDKIFASDEGYRSYVRFYESTKPSFVNRIKSKIKRTFK